MRHQKKEKRMKKTKTSTVHNNWRENIRLARIRGSEINDLCGKIRDKSDGGYGCTCAECLDVEEKNKTIWENIDRKTTELSEFLQLAFNHADTIRRENIVYAISEKFHVGF